jgi:hypothetical protein
LHLLAATLSVIVLIIHWAFVLFVALGGVIALAKPIKPIILAHIVCIAWAIASLTIGIPCPLTWTENSLRGIAEMPSYPNGCLDFYIPRTLSLLHLPQMTLHQLALIALLINLVCYVIIFVSSRRRDRSTAPS